MGFLHRISIKNFLIGVVGLLAAILTIVAVSNVLDNYRESREIARVDVANELADYILVASGKEGVERGVTAANLASGEPAEIATVQKIKDLRDAGDEAFHKAYSLAEELSTLDSSNTVLLTAMKKAKQGYESVQGGRSLVDSNLRLAEKSYSPKEWISLMTSFIDAGAELRVAAFSSTASKQTLQEALRMNLELKQAVWLVSEYAGRERATLANYVASKKPLDQATHQKLDTFRAIVDLNLKPILRLKDRGGVDATVLESIAAMESNFLGSFQSTREAVYKAAATGDYPLSGKEWIGVSTSGINTILDVSAAVGVAVDDVVMADLAASKRAMWLSVGFLALIIALSCASFWVINTKVIAPMHYLSDTMAGIEKTGELATRIDIKSEDENGQMAETFNKMMGKFHDVIQQIHSSVARLASSSEELSATSVQIAGGTEAQSARALQVSTASQEMSATITEVVRNVSSAAEAAEDASGVAQRGGDIVTRTIGSMNGIATTAKESSQIISLLGGRSQEIGNIINVIDDIADQTNLLALNAAIEAARAGEQGRGFAVVADEVRKLAEKTMSATKEIGGMIKAMQDETSKAITSMNNEVKAVEEGVTLAREAGDALGEIVAKVDVVTDMIQQITTATQQQSAATDQISSDIEMVAGVVSETSASAQQIAGASSEIAELASSLKGIVELFNVSGEKSNVIELGKGAGKKTAAALPSTGRYKKAV